MQATPFFHFFEQDISNFSLPKKFTYPFYYDTHPLCDLAAKQVQYYIENQKDWVHPFTTDNNLNSKSIGKMFGVLVVCNHKNEIGFLSAFSGKLAGTNQHKYFVPPVFDMLTKQSHFLEEEEILNTLNVKIEKLELNNQYLNNLKKLEQIENLAKEEILKLRNKMILDKKERKIKRKIAKENLNSSALKVVLEQLAKESVTHKSFLKKQQEAWSQKINDYKAVVDQHKEKIIHLKNVRKERSNALQKYLFSQYQFLNINQEKEDLLDIFKKTAFEIPPAGAGECAAPKLLQYAFKNKLTPICMAEFWWGDSPKSEIKKHGQYYPSCQGKCKPILSHMLKGINVDKNPLDNNPAIGKELTIEYEDQDIVVVNKPAEFLSVPGKSISDSVYMRMKQKYPNASGPLIIHRLDMSTSGLMIIAKNKAIHQQIQDQFIKRTITKRYVALLAGIPVKTEKHIDLPLRLDINDRPRQLVCFEHGKKATTKWEIIEQKNNNTKVYFYPVTGRTHQLRVHAAHTLGLNCPIVGDDLYGKKSDRLHLHAESITFYHPKLGKNIQITTPACF